MVPINALQAHEGQPDTMAQLGTDGGFSKANVLNISPFISPCFCRLVAEHGGALFPSSLLQDFDVPLKLKITDGKEKLEVGAYRREG